MCHPSTCICRDIPIHFPWSSTSTTRCHRLPIPIVGQKHKQDFPLFPVMAPRPKQRTGAPLKRCSGPQRAGQLLERRKLESPKTREIDLYIYYTTSYYTNQIHIYIYTKYLELTRTDTKIEPKNEDDEDVPADVPPFEPVKGHSCGQEMAATEASLLVRRPHRPAASLDLLVASNHSSFLLITHSKH